MKSLSTVILPLALALLFSSCGKESQVTSSAATATGCPLYFPSEDLCAEISWEVGPSADTESSFNVSFWKKSTGSAAGPLTEPTSQVGSYIRMTCCGSISFPETKKVANGKYSVTKVRFVPGSWEVYVHLKNGEMVEKQFVPVNLDG